MAKLDLFVTWFLVESFVYDITTFSPCTLLILSKLLLIPFYSRIHWPRFLTWIIFKGLKNCHKFMTIFVLLLLFGLGVQPLSDSQNSLCSLW